MTRSLLSRGNNIISYKEIHFLKSLEDQLIKVISDDVEIKAAESEIQIQVDGREQTLINIIPLQSTRLRRR